LLGTLFLSGLNVPTASRHYKGMTGFAGV
jgi:hypothetical protein